MGKNLKRRQISSVGAAVALLMLLGAFGQLYAQLSSSLTDGPLGRLADWVIANGKQTVLNAPVAEAMGLGVADLPMHGQAFKPSGDDHLHIVLVGTSQGRTDIVLTHTSMDQVGPMWLTSPTGALRKTIYEDANGISVVTDGKYNADFEQQKAYFVSKVPGQ